MAIRPVIIFDNEVFAAGDLIVVPPASRPKREPTGRLSPQPRILLAVYSEEFDAIQLEPLTFAVAMAGWPDQVKAKWPQAMGMDQVPALANEKNEA